MIRILIIDDDMETRSILEQTLTSVGYDVCTVSDGKEGLAELSIQPADLILTDLFMPNQDGLETITEIRKRFPQSPIIAMSGGSIVSQSMLAVAKQLGAARVLEKPFDIETLLYTVETVSPVAPRLC